MYFNKFPKINYNFQNGKNIEVADIFRKVSFSQSFRNKDSAFLKTLISQGEKPERIANAIYLTPEYSWMLFLANNIVNPHTDWPTEYSKLLEITKAKYNGYSYFITNLPKLLEGDIAVYCNSVGEEWDFSKYTIIDKWDTRFRYFRGLGGLGNISALDYVRFFRIGSNGVPALVPNTSVSRIIKKVEYYNTLTDFYTNTSIVNPYTIVNGSDQLTGNYASPISTIVTPDDTYALISTIGETVLFNYINGNPYGASITTILDQVLKENNKHQNVNILKPEFSNIVSDLFQTAIDSRYIGRALQIDI